MPLYFCSPPARLPRALLVALGLGLGLTSFSWAQSDPAQADPAQADLGVTIERREIFTQLSAGQTLRVENLFGDIRARFGGYEGVVETRAVFQHMAAEGPRLELESVAFDGAESRGGLIRVGYREGDQLRTSPVPGQKKRVDLVVLVPQGVHLVAQTLDGTFQARGLQSSVVAITRGGRMEARSIQGGLDLTTESGAILAAPESRGERTPQRFRSASGRVELYLRDDGHFQVDGSTRGLLTTDFTTQVALVADDPSGSALKRITAVVGKGLTPIAIDAGTGQILLRRKPSVGEARARQSDGEDSP